MTTRSHSKWREIGPPWLLRVPAHWEVRRGKTLFDSIDVRSKSGAEELLTVSANHGVIPRNSANVTMFQAETYEGYKLCWPDDLVINSLWAWSRGLAVSNYHGIVSSAYGVYRTRNRVQYHPQFINYLVRSAPFQWELQIRSKGIWISRLQLTDEAFLAIPFPVPPPEEQVAIVRFLDHADEQIQRYIAAKERLIKLLEEQRQALVHQAVTRGLDPSVRLKPSGVEWLGEVPEGWELRRIRSLAAIGTGDKDTINRDVEGKYPFFVRSQNVERIDTWSFDGEAVLTAGDGAGVGKVFHYFNGKFDFHQRVYKFSDFKDILGKFFYYSLKASLPYLTQQGTAKSTVDSLRLPMLQNIKTTVPPSEEQEELTRYLEQAEHRIDYAVAQARSQTDLMNEYRTRLIADVVTGQLDVRKAAAQLPVAP